MDKFGQDDDLVGDDVPFTWNPPAFDDIVSRIDLHSGDEVHAAVVPAPELLVVDVPLSAAAIASGSTSAAIWRQQKLAWRRNPDIFPGI